MVFDVNASNNIPLSSASSCTDCFSNGCYSKIHNDYHIHFQNCQCHPCCVNSMINDHTYSLLKKICRKVIKDYQRQQCREKYTIFDGGNSINVRIHRSSCGEDGIPMPDGPSFFKQKDNLNQNKVKRISHRSGKGRNKKTEHFDETGKGDGTKQTGGTGKYRKYYPNGFGDNGIQRNEEDEPKRSQAKGKAEESRDDNGNKKRGRKGRQMTEDERSKNEGQGKVEKKRDYVAENMSEKQEKRSTGERKEGEIGKRKIGMSHGADGENPYVEASRTKDKGKKPEDASKERSYDRSGRGKDKKLDEIGDDDKSNEGSKLYSKSGKKTPEKPRKSDKIKRNNEEHEELGTRTETKRGKGWKNGSLEDGASNVNDNVKSVVGDRQGSRKIDANDKAARAKDKTQIERNFRLKDGHDIGGEEDRYLATTTKNTSRKKLLPVISNLRAKVRKGHDIVPSEKKSMGKGSIRSSEYQEFGIRARLGQRTTNKKAKQGQRQLSKSSKNRINERYGSKRNTMPRRPRRFGGYRTWLPSRCDEIRPCDVLRAHMEQRELCERRRFCLPYPYDCSAVYCESPSRCCRIY